MQSLCVQVEADHAALQRVLKALPAMQRRAQALSAYLHGPWLADVDAIAQVPKAEQRVHDAAPAGHYSVLAQDTIWDALTDADADVRALTKALARRL